MTKTKKEIADGFRLKSASRMFPDAPNQIEGGMCPVCGQNIGAFKDALSEREYEISGMCQKCQDATFDELVEE